MNPFKRFYEYFSRKSGKQRVFFIIGFILIAVFVFFFIKGNFFDNKIAAQSSEMSISDTSQSEENSNSQIQYEDAEFHISLLDLLILLVIIIIFVIHKIREKIRHRRM